MKTDALVTASLLLAACDEAATSGLCFADEDCPSRSTCYNGKCSGGPAEMDAAAPADSGDLCGWITERDLEERPWTIRAGGGPAVELESVDYPALDAPALRCAIGGGVVASNARCSLDLAAAPNASRFVLRASFYYQPFTTFDEGGGPSAIRSLSFSVSKIQDGRRWDLALEWRNVDDGDGDPSWRHSDGIDWVTFAPAERLRARTWHHLELQGRLSGDDLIYDTFSIDGAVRPLAVMISAVPEAGASKLSLAIALESRFSGSVVEVFADGVSLDYCSADCDTAVASYEDRDHDGFGAAHRGLTACTVPPGYVSNADDCDDSSQEVKPSTTGEKSCDGVDNDCNGFADDTDLLRSEIAGGLRALDAMTIDDTGLVIDHMPVLFDPPHGISPALFVAPQFPYFELMSKADGNGGRLESAMDFSCTRDLASMRLDLDLSAVDAYAVQILPFGGLAPVSAPDQGGIDLHRYRALHLVWRAASSTTSPIDIDIKLKSADGVLRSVPGSITPSFETDCGDPAGWEEESIELSRFGDEEFLGKVAQLEFGANGSQLRNAIIHIDSIWFEPVERAILDGTIACPDPCKSSCNIAPPPGLDCTRANPCTPDCPSGFVYPDLACGAAIAGADKVALSLLAIQIAPELGLLDIEEAKAHAERAIATLERRGRWNGETESLAIGSGLLPNWFGPFGEPSARDRHVSLTDVGDEVATMMVLSGLFSERGWNDLASRTRALADGGLAAIRRLIERGRTRCLDKEAKDAIFGAVLLGDDDSCAIAEPSIQCGWRHTAANDSLLGSALAIVAGAADRAQWDKIVFGSCQAPVNACPTPCSAPASCSNESGLCVFGDQEFMPACFPGGACPAENEPPYAAEGGLFLANKPMLFLHGGSHPASRLRALPTESISVADSADAAARAQKEFAKDRLQGWGWSNCADPRRPGYLGGLCLEEDIVTPHALMFALSADPGTACEVLELLDRCTPIGAPFVLGGSMPRDFGMRDSIDLGPWNRGEAACGAAPPNVTRDVWLSMDIAMGILAYFNHATGGRLRFLFEAGGGDALYERLGTAHR